jgi:hypothetical protein
MAKLGRLKIYALFYAIVLFLVGVLGLVSYVQGILR